MSEFAAIDLGASSGRVMLGRLDDGVMALEELHRFENVPVRLPDGMRWNLLQLFSESIGALHGRSLAGVGVDTWGVDYGLVDRGGKLLGVPFHYRDDRTTAVVKRAFERVPEAEQYALSGIQTMPINTVFQLLADEDSPALANAHAVALVPDLLAYWLSGELANEKTNASTTALLDARRGEWSHELIGRLGLPTRLFDGLVEPGTELGRVLAHHEIDASVYTVASHDTASAYAGTSIRDEHAAVLSSGTWSLLGLELPAPVFTDPQLTNERGIDGTIRLLKNVMGLWLEQECARTWSASFEDLHRAARDASTDVPVFNPDQDAFLTPGDMPQRIADACRRAGQRAPDGRGETIRSIFVSLACAYRLVLERLESASGRDVRAIHVIGGGARNELLCQLTADLTGREVIAGPVEATALGNVLVQARAAGELGSLEDMRAVAAASVEPTIYEPDITEGQARSIHERFLDAKPTDPEPT